MLLSANFKKAKMLTMFPLIKELGKILQKNCGCYFFGQKCKNQNIAKSKFSEKKENEAFVLDKVEATIYKFECWDSTTRWPTSLPFT